MTFLRSVARATRRFINPPAPPPLSADDDVRDIEADLDAELDPDLHIITDYYANELPATQRAEVERRLETDARFARKAEPIRMLWDPALDEPLMSDQKLLESWMDFRNRAGLPPVELPTAKSQPEHLMSAARVPATRGRPQWGPTRSLLFAAALAAVIAVPLLFYMWGRSAGDPGPAPVQWVGTPPGAAALILADGSRVTLYPRSSFERVAGATGRVHALAGRATFTVASRPGEPFEVRTHTAIIVVTGTVFTVQAYPGDPFTEVEVQEGSVVVTRLDGGQRVSLSAGNRGRF